MDIFSIVTIFVLAIFVGVEIITKVPPTLHTPLMSGTNAISGITLLGGLALLASSDNLLTSIIGFLAVTLDTVNVVGGFAITDRILKMFKKR
jgi:NAD(P) transhydrogenase subunit alpha